MNNRNNEGDISFFKYLLQPRPILDFFRAFLYILFAVFFYSMPDFLSEHVLYRYLFCGAALFYGFYRMYRIYSDYKKMYR